MRMLNFQRLLQTTQCHQNNWTNVGDFEEMPVASERIDWTAQQRPALRNSGTWKLNGRSTIGIRYFQDDAARTK
ncbi:hypothetical protein Trydic_g1559 [Trypoxylus dichotomus]